MLNNFASTQQGGTGTVTTTTILDGTIANADVASDAAIDVSKISLDDAVVFNESGADKRLSCGVRRQDTYAVCRWWEQ